MFKPKLRVWWIPQIPMKRFYVYVRNLREAKLVLDTLVRYDDFQFKNNIKPDYCYTGGLQEYIAEFHSIDEYSGWFDWYDGQFGMDFYQYCGQHPELLLIEDK